MCVWGGTKHRRIADVKLMSVTNKQQDHLHVDQTKAELSFYMYKSTPVAAEIK